MKTEELKSCPRCASRDVELRTDLLYPNDDTDSTKIYFIACTKCLIQDTGYETYAAGFKAVLSPQRALEIWNNRF